MRIGGVVMSDLSLKSPVLANANSASLSISDTLSRKIDKSSKDFEAILIGNWIDKAQEAFGVAADGSTDPGSGTYRQLGAQAIAQMMANRDALGIGRMVAASLAKSALSGGTHSVTNSSAADVDK